jgi:pimeloyl-ACP methyl ester carboxylesterase
VVLGESDWLIPPNVSRVIAESAHGAELELIPEAGHDSFIEQSETYADPELQLALSLPLRYRTVRKTDLLDPRCW